MGERRALNTTRMGDVVWINTGDGVFTGREPHTSHRNQMKLFKSIAAAALKFQEWCVTSTHAYEKSTAANHPC